MLRLRPYKHCDSLKIAKWIKDEDVFLKWGGDRFGDFPISAEIIDEKYSLKNGDCAEPDNFYPWVAFDDENGVIGHFIMRYIHGDNRVLRFGWVVVDDTIRGKGYGTEMLKLGLKYAFEILGVDVVTIGVFENNDRAHSCYRKVGFVDRETEKREVTDEKPADRDRWHIIEMEIDRNRYLI